MARRYAMTGDQTAAAQGAASVLAWVESAASGDARISIYDCVIGSTGTPADATANFSIFTASGGTPAGTAGTESPLLVGDEAAGATGLTNLTTSPTTIVSLVEVPLNQRATFRWVAAPGSEITASSTAGNGAGIETLTVDGTAYEVRSTLLWME